MAGPTATNPKLWLKADAGVYSDSGSTLATNGQGVKQWNDQSGNSNHATQTTSGNRPVFLTSVANSLPGVSFTRASSQYLNNAFLGEPQTVFVVCKPASVSNYQALLGADTGDASPPQVGAYYFQVFTNEALIFARATSADTSGALDFSTSTNTLDESIVTGKIYVCKGWRSGTTIKSWAIPELGTGVSTFPWSNSNSSNSLRSIATPCVIGGDVYSRSVTDFWDGDIFEVIIYDTPLSDIEMCQVDAYLWNKWCAPTSQLFALSHFDQFGGSGTEYFRMALSSDAVNWYVSPVMYKPTGSHVVRDPSVIAFNNLNWWIAHTSAGSSGGGFVQSTSFDIAFSSDGHIWTYITSPDCSAASGTTDPQVWAPEWFADTSAPYGVRVLVAISSSYQNAGGPFAIYEMHPTNSSFTSWSAPTQLTGTGIPTQCIDPQMIKIGSIYYLIAKDNQSQYIDVFTSTSLLSGYTALRTGNWAGWGKSEGPSMILIGGTWYAFSDPDAYQGFGIAYSTQSQGAGDWTGTNANSWTSPLTAVTLIGDSYTPRHGTIIPYPTNRVIAICPIIRGFFNQQFYDFLRDG